MQISESMVDSWVEYCDYSCDPLSVVFSSLFYILFSII